MINPVNQTDFPAAIAALGDQPSLGHVTTMLAVAGMLLQAYGLFALVRLGNGQRCLAGTALRMGCDRQSLRLGHLHCSPGPATTPGDLPHATQLEPFRGAGHVQAAVSRRSPWPVKSTWPVCSMGFLWNYPIASILVGLGLDRLDSAPWTCLQACGFLRSCRHRSWGVWSILCLRSTLPTLDVNALLVANNILQMIGALCLFVIGLGLYQGRSELVPEESSG